MVQNQTTAGGHLHLTKLDIEGTAYAVMIPGVLPKACGVISHSPTHLHVVVYDDYGASTDLFVNLAAVPAVEVEQG